MTNENQLLIFNSLTGKKEPFIACNNSVTIYVCGVTPYDITHLGHAFTYVFFDVVVRYLEYLEYSIRYIQNVTDIDDDILKKAKESGEDWRSLAERNFSLFLKDLNFLNIRPPDFYPRATDHIPEIIAINQSLLEKGFAYEKNGSLYFDIGKFPDYGRLSRLTHDEMLPVSRTRGNKPDDPDKKNPLDFILWQSRSPQEPYWDSPWGPGRPGWHIECSAMSMKYLGDTIDIHGGGGDLVYPHHESENAQSRSATGRPFTRFFMHTSMLYYEGEKMSKSLGNMVFVKDLKEKYSANVLRLLFLSHHYRTKWEYTPDSLAGALRQSELFTKVWRTQSSSGKELDLDSYKSAFFSSLNDDFDTPAALTELSNLSEKIIESPLRNVSSAKAFLNSALNILGLKVEY